MTNGQSLSNLEFYQHLSKVELEEMLELGNKISMKSGDCLISQGEKSEYFYIILSGSAEVRKEIHSEDFADTDFIDFDSDQMTFKKFGPGRIVGESGFFDGKDRTQSVVLSEDSQVVKISFESLAKLKRTNHDLYSKMVNVLGNHVTYRLRKSNKLLVDTMITALISAKKRLYFTQELLAICIIGCFLLLGIDFFRHAYDTLPGLGDSIITGFIMILIYAALKVNKKQPKKEFFGLTLKNFGKNTLVGVYYSIVMMLVVTVSKYFVISGDQKLFHGIIISGTPFIAYFTNLVVYLAFTFLQELIARGILQSTFQEIFGQGKKEAWLAIFLSNMLFASFHTLVFPTISVLVLLVVGLPWGWMYYRSRSLVGPIVSHGIVGFYVLWILGLL